jgi:iron complex outermembrane receptor protein
MTDAINRKFVMTPLAAGVIAALSPVSNTYAQESEESSKSLEEITVTATRRELNLQDVAQSITAFSNDDIAEMGVRSMADYIKAMPSVALTETKPGVTSLSIRGISGGAFEYRLQDQTTIYLDEQAMTTSAQNISVRPIDMERIEVLPGPQGTLFGSSSQTGTLRLITNKPDFKEFSGMIQADVGSTSGGAESHDISGVLNMPLVDDKFALRAVAYSTLDGGWVDNVLGSSYSGNFDNADLVEDDYNEYETTGGRLSALWQISDDWDVLFNIMTEQNESHGEWETDPSLGGDRIVRFFDDFKEDNWTSVGLTMRGDLGFAALSVTAQTMDRDFAYEWDNNAYTQNKDRNYGGAYLRYTENCYATNPSYGDYSCSYAAAYYFEPGTSDTVYSYYGRYYTNYAFSTIANDQDQERDQVEIRLTSQSEGKLQWMLGGYYEEIYDTWFYRTVMPDHTSTTAFATAYAYAYLYKYTYGYTNLQVPLPDTIYHYAQTMERTNTQIAVFGEIDYDFTDKTRGTVGVRWAENEREEYDQYEWPVGLPAVGGYGSDGIYVSKGKSDDTFYKLGLQHQIDDDKMVYALFSQGFRLGGTNSVRAADSGFVPLEYDPDFMDNYEIGLKSEWADNTFQLNISAFHMKWSDYQNSVFNIGQWWVRGIVNGGGAESTGVEVNFTWQATDRLKVRGSVFSADAKFTDDFFSPDDPTNLEIRDGQDMPNSPSLKTWLSLGYDVPNVLGGDLSFYYDVTYQAEVWNTTGNARDESADGLAPSWVHHNFSVGLNLPNQFNVTMKVNNVFDQDSASYINDYIQGYSETFANQSRDRLNANQGRPRTVWLSLRKDF